MTNQNPKPKNMNPKTPNVRIFKLNLTTLALLVGGMIFFYFLFSSLYQPNLGKEVQFSEFIQSLIQNRYAQVDIRDDGKALGYSKYVHNVTNEEVEIGEKTGTDVVNNLTEVSIEDFIKKIEPPKSIQESIDLVLNRGDSFRVENIVIGENFVIVQKAGSDGGDLIIKDTTEEAFLDELQVRGIDLSKTAKSVIYLRSAAKQVSADDLKLVNDQEKYSDIWVAEGFTVALLKVDQIERSFTTVTETFGQDLLKYLQDQGFDIEKGNVEINSVQVQNINILDLLTLAGLLVLVGGLFFIFRGIQGSSNSLMRFGQSKAGVFFGRKPEVTFKDVAGVDEAKEELKEVVQFLKYPKKFLKLGARIPKGILLVGAPGTGKTLLARAIAGEAGVPFFHTSGSEFEEMLVGAGASRVRDLFDKAKRAAPALVFVDEIDAVARKRGTTIQSSTTEQTLNQILVEMDGFKKNENVIIIAATNRPDVLDPAILRPGRFDRRVVLDLPDIEGRKDIIKIHAANKPLSTDVDIEKVAKRTVGFSGADLENMLNEAAIIVAKNNKSEITMKDIEEAATKVSLGPERRRKRDDYELKVTAYHEAGHAIVARLTEHSDPVHRITIVSRGMSLGSTMQLPQIDKMQQTKTELESRLKVLLGGRAAEEIVFKDITGGASSDIEKATSITRKMVKLLGMSDKLGLIKYGESNELQYLGYGYGEQRDYSEKTAELIDEEVRQIMHKAYDGSKKILEDNMDILHAVAKDLLDHEVIEADEFENYFKDKKNLPPVDENAPGFESTH